ncbi:radical SAM protein [candidate division KSB1 bacterium]
MCKNYAIPSVYTYAYRQGRSMILYQALTNKKTVGGYTLVDLWETASRSVNNAVPIDRIPKDLLLHGFFIIADSDADKAALNDIRDLCTDFPRNDIWLFCTENCVGACKYCRQRIAGITGTMRLSEFDLKEFWKWYFQQILPQSVSLTLFGGEPLLLGDHIFSLVDESMNACHAAGISLDEINLFTNAVLITSKLVSKLVKRQIKVVISLDGPEWINDVMRGKGRFNSAIHAKQLFNNIDVNVGISMVIASHNAKYLPDISLYLAKEIKPVNVCFIPLHRTMGAPIENTISYQYISRKMLEAYELAAPLGLYIENISRKVDLFVSNSLCYSNCGATGQRVVCFPDGTVGPCQSSYIEASLRCNLNAVNLNEPLFTKWIKRSPYFDENCLRCPCLSICGGGCGLDATQIGGDIITKDFKDCAFSNAFLEWAMKMILNNIVEDTPITICSSEYLSFLRLGLLENSNLPFSRVAGYGKISKEYVPGSYREKLRKGTYNYV